MGQCPHQYPLHYSALGGKTWRGMGYNEVYAEYFREDQLVRTALVVNFGAADNLVEVTSTAGIPT